MPAGSAPGSPATARRKKIAILGGGIAGLTTALHLSATQALREQHEITVYQMGWRLGGKCATGRGPAGRVQEHGIHLFGGGYYNALALMRAVYDELRGPDGAGWPVRFETAFEPQSVSLTPQPGGGVAVMSFARNGLRHGRDTAPATVRQWLWRGAVNLAHTGLQGLRAGQGLPLDRSARGYVCVILRGLLMDRLWRRRSFGDLDREPYDAWLKRHGASDAVIDSPLAQAPLRLLYQYPGGDAAAHPRGDMGAGAYLQWVLRTVAYLGAPFWFFQEGTGESVIQPLYELLRRRGVRFEFFHRVEKLVPDATGTALAEVRMQVQATTRGGLPYDPLQRCGKMGTWPDRPLYGQLVQGGALAALPPGELEDTWSTWPGAGRKVLRVRAAGQAAEGDDPQAVDQVVLAISLGALPGICAPLIAAHPRWAQMVARLRTVETHTLQLWLSEPSHKLTGDKLHARDDDEDTGLGCGLAHPFDGFSDFTPLIAHEHWPAGGEPKSLWYFSDVLAGSPPHGQAQAPGYEAQRQTAALQASRAFVDGALLRGLFTQPVAAKPASGKGFNDALLVAPPGAPPAPGADPLTAQWARAHVQPSERYVQAPAGSADARLEASASGFAGLVLAGDWIHTGLNVGCVEAAVMSGRLAANAVTGRPAGEGLVGYLP